MILPEGKNKKYIKTVIGIYVVFTIISPIISKISNSNTLDLNKYFKTENNITIETSKPAVVDTNEYIEEVYKEKLKTDIKTNLGIGKLEAEGERKKLKNISITINSSHSGLIKNVNMILVIFVVI